MFFIFNYTENSVDGNLMIESDEQIYWLRPKLRPSLVRTSGDNSTDSGIKDNLNNKGCLNKKLKPKVTFNDLPSTSSSW